jgi:hypothetical protein
MKMDISETQQKRVAKVSRLREYFAPNDRPEIHEWSPTDEKFAFELMTNQEIKQYLGRAGRDRRIHAFRVATA